MPENDITIRPSILNTNEFNNQRLTPCFLITLDGKKKDIYFVATKEDCAPAFVIAVGFFYEGDIAELVKNPMAIIQEMYKTPEAFVEVKLPWARIQSSRSLVYRHKVKQQ